VLSEAIRLAFVERGECLHRGPEPLARPRRPLHRFSLDDTAAAHDAVESGVTGKVLIDVGE
jgi:hypothetical protein